MSYVYWVCLWENLHNLSFYVIRLLSLFMGQSTQPLLLCHTFIESVYGKIYTTSPSMSYVYWVCLWENLHNLSFYVIRLLSLFMGKSTQPLLLCLSFIEQVYGKIYTTSPSMSYVYWVCLWENLHKLSFYVIRLLSLFMGKSTQPLLLCHTFIESVYRKIYTTSPSMSYVYWVCLWENLHNLSFYIIRLLSLFMWKSIQPLLLCHTFIESVYRKIYTTSPSMSYVYWVCLWENLHNLSFYVIRLLSLFMGKSTQPLLLCHTFIESVYGKIYTTSPFMLYVYWVRSWENLHNLFYVIRSLSRAIGKSSQPLLLCHTYIVSFFLENHYTLSFYTICSYRFFGKSIRPLLLCHTYIVSFFFWKIITPSPSIPYVHIGFLGKSIRPLLLCHTYIVSFFFGKSLHPLLLYHMFISVFWENLYDLSFYV